MAYDDVYKLVQQQLAQGQGKGRNQFYDPTVDFAMKIPEMIQNEKDKKDVANKDALTNIASLIDKVNTPEGFANINASLNDLESNSEGNSEINTNIAILRGINKTSQQNYNTYKEGVDRGLEYVNSDSFPKDMKSYQNLSEIALNSGFKNEDGTGNQLEYLYAEKEKINAIMDKLSLGTDGKTQKFSYGKGVDRSVIRKLQEHNNQIDIAVQTLAGDGIITKDEAYHIMSGDKKFYAEDKKNALAEARDILKSGMSTDKSLTNLLSKKSFDDDDHDILAGYNINSKELEETPGGREVINNYIKEAMTKNNQRMQINNQKYKDWSGRNYDPSLAMGKPFYTDDDIGGESVEGEGTYDEQGRLIDPAKPSKPLAKSISNLNEKISNIKSYEPTSKIEETIKNKFNSTVDSYNEFIASKEGQELLEFKNAEEILSQYGGDKSVYRANLKEKPGYRFGDYRIKDSFAWDKDNGFSPPADLKKDKTAITSEGYYGKIDIKEKQRIKDSKESKKYTKIFNEGWIKYRESNDEWRESRKRYDEALKSGLNPGDAGYSAVEYQENEIKNIERKLLNEFAEMVKSYENYYNNNKSGSSNDLIYKKYKKDIDNLDKALKLDRKKK